MTTLFAWVFLAILVGAVASARQRSGLVWFLVSLLLSPVLGLLFLLVTGTPQAQRHAEPGPSTHVKCPACREWVLPDAIKCKHCGSGLEPRVPATGGTDQPATPLLSTPLKVFWTLIAVVVVVTIFVSHFGK